MTEYIDISELLSSPVWKFSHSISDKYATGYADALDAVEDVINQLPVVDIIRCGKCKHFKLAISPNGSPEPDHGFCTEPKSQKGMAGVRVSKSHYCGFGEKKEE